MKSCRVLLVDDQAMFRQGLTRLLRDVDEIEVVGQACGAAEAFRQIREFRPDVLVIDANLLTGDGTDLLIALCYEAPDVKIVALTASDEHRDVLTMTKTRVDGYVAKSAPADVLIRSILGAMHGDLAFNQTATGHASALTKPGRAAGDRPVRSYALSDRERQVLRMVAAGADNREIARALSVSTSTVRSHLHRVHDKLGLENRVQIALYALRQGIYP